MKKPLKNTKQYIYSSHFRNQHSMSFEYIAFCFAELVL
nr:MAG TPA: hypothetical protein [Caudoviricetes sp.]